MIKSFNLFHSITAITSQPVVSKSSEHEQIESSEVDFDVVTPMPIKDRKVLSKQELASDVPISQANLELPERQQPQEEPVSHEIPPIPATQTALDDFFTSSTCQMQDSTDPTVKELSCKLNKVLNLLTEKKSTEAEKTFSKGKSTSNEIPGLSAKNISNFLEQNKDIELIGESEQKIIRCKICFVYLNSKTALQRASHLPSSGCISTGLPISAESYQNCVLGHNNTWYRLKKRLLDHFNSNESKTHMDAVAWWHYTKALQERKNRVVENQIRTALGIVQTKCAAQSYETRIAELQMSGADCW